MRLFIIRFIVEISNNNKGGPAKGGSMEPMEPPLDPPLLCPHFQRQRGKHLHSFKPLPGILNLKYGTLTAHLDSDKLNM